MVNKTTVGVAGLVVGVALSGFVGLGSRSTAIVQTAPAAAVSTSAPAAVGEPLVIVADPAPAPVETTTAPVPTEAKPAAAPRASAQGSTSTTAAPSCDVEGGTGCGSGPGDVEWYRNPADGSCTQTDAGSTAGSGFVRDDSCATNHPAPAAHCDSTGGPGCGSGPDDVEGWRSPDGQCQRTDAGSAEPGWTRDDSCLR
jgi:hypothetical protein